jgi:predicted AAA+ superfamily ATPase
MAHLRDRALTLELRKQLKFWPILTLLGPRQSGKSTFLRDLVFEKLQYSYLSLDRIAARDAAQRNPEQFLSSIESEPAIIDEAHKAPDLFDEIKASVDEDRRPGRFILTGSVRFSAKLGIRESFTGRAANLRFDSMTLGETLSGHSPNIKSIHRYLKMGGMPAVCFLRDSIQIERYWTEWIETTCHRDLREAGGTRLDGDLAHRILECASQLDFPSSTEIASRLRVDARRIRTHLEGLESLFLLRKWEPDPNSVGKPLYLPFDCGLASYFQAPLRRLWQVWFAHTLLNRARFSGKKEPRLQYNLTTRGSFADFVIDDEVTLFHDGTYPTPQMMKTLTALEKRLPDHSITVASQTDQPARKVTPRIWSRPWASFAG